MVDVQTRIIDGRDVSGILMQMYLEDEGRDAIDDSVSESDLVTIALKEIALESTLLDMAIEAKLMEDPDCVRQLREYRTNLLVDFLEEAVREEVRPSEEEGREFFEQHKEDYRKPDSALFRHIFINAGFLDTAVERNRDDAKKLVSEVRALAAQGEDFGLLVQKYSDSASAQHGGLVGYVFRGNLHPEIEKAVFALEPGEVGMPAETKSGFHLVQLINMIPSVTPEWEDTREDVLSQIERERLAKTLHELKEEMLKNADVRDNLDRLVLLKKEDDLLFSVGVDRLTIADFLHLFPREKSEVMIDGQIDANRLDKDKLRGVFERALLAEAAHLRGYADTPEIRSKMEARTRQLLIDLQFQNLCSEELREVLGDEDQLRAIYEENKDEYRTDVRIVIDRIPLTFPKETSEAAVSRFLARKLLRSNADRVHQLLAKRAEISDLKQYGVSQIRTMEAPLEIGELEQELQHPIRLRAQELLEAGLGDEAEIPDPRVLEPVEVPDGYVIVRITQVYSGRQKAFEEVQQEVEARILEWKQREVAKRQAEELLREIAFKSEM